ncbi:hypothetical protein HK105_202269 [Polyrhizophydium stewartii]|uniref:Metallo-beta-lactamase domain-containing protein n=1 Tax=Polyrhizophydium stewartii TaxID=2732419 RepID=A0ABR4NFQ5_9FUNG
MNGVGIGIGTSGSVSPARVAAIAAAAAAAALVGVACFEQGRFLITRPVRRARVQHHWELVFDDGPTDGQGVNGACETLIEAGGDAEPAAARQSSHAAAPAQEDAQRCGACPADADATGLGIEDASAPVLCAEARVAGVRAPQLLLDLLSAGLWLLAAPAALLGVRAPWAPPAAGEAQLARRRMRWRQKLFNSLGVAGRFVNPFVEWQDRNTADIAGYIRWQLTRNNRNGVPSDQRELERTMPLARPDFGLLEAYTASRGRLLLPVRSAALAVSASLPLPPRAAAAAAGADGTLAAPPDAPVMTVTWIGQSTCFVQMDGFNILTDPIFSSRTVGEWFGPKRIRPSPCQLDELPKIDLVLVSHNHYDHLDIAVVRKLANSVTWVVPLGMGTWFKSVGVTTVVELDWWQEHRFSDTLVITGAPIQHWSGRHFFDVNLSLWASFVVRGPTASFFHCGDTGYCQAFAEVGRRLGPITFASLPIGSYEPREYMRHQHMDPEEACMVHRDIRAAFSLGVHWGTFMMSDEHYLDPPKHLEEGRIKLGLPAGSVFTSLLGKTLLIQISRTHSNRAAVNEKSDVLLLDLEQGPEFSKPNARTVKQIEKFIPAWINLPYIQAVISASLSAH